MGFPPDKPIPFKELVENYAELQIKLLKNIESLSKEMSKATPGQFLLIQFQMAQVTQIGESISNLISQINTLINATIRNQKSQ